MLCASLVIKQGKSICPEFIFKKKKREREGGGGEVVPHLFLAGKANARNILNTLESLRFLLNLFQLFTLKYTYSM